MGAVENLLEKVDVLRFKYDVLNDLERRSFNVFSVLFREKDEVSLHSRFIAELLNPHGQHGKGGTFLRLFLDRIPGSDALVDVADSCSVQREVSGIDILIRCGRKAVILENKINAGDQKRQLERYFEYVRDSLKVPEDEIRIVYLTLDGHKPSEKSVGGLDKKKIDRVSYKKEVLGWLEDCIRESAQDPALRESLVQYRQLVKKITGHELSEEYMDELINLLLKDVKYLRAAKDIAEVFTRAKTELECRFWVALEAELKRRFADKVAGGYRDNIGDKWYGIKVSLGLKDWEVDCSYYFEMGSGQRICQGFYYTHKDSEGNVIGYPEDEKNKLRSIIEPICPEFEEQHGDWWFGYKELDIDFNSFDKEPTSKIFTDEGLSAYVGKLVDDAERHIKAFEASIATAASH